MAIRNSTLQLKARVTGSSGAKAVPHMAQPCANAVAGGMVAAPSAATRPGNSRCTGRVIPSVRGNEREEEEPEPADEVPVERAHLQAGPRAPARSGVPLADREDGEPEHGDEDVHRVAADQEGEGAAVGAAGGRGPVGQQAD